MKRCKDCYWWMGDACEVTINGKISPCVNIGVDGWHYWCVNQKEPENCEGFCKDGEYVPTGIWAGVAELLETITKKKENEP